METAIRQRTFKREQSDFGRRIGHDHLCIKQADQRDKQTDTYGNRPFQTQRNDVKNRLPHIGQRHEDKDDAFHANRSQSHLPGIAHLLYYGKGKIRI